MYNVYTILTVNDKVVDVQKTKTGFRKTEFKGGAGTGGVWLNHRFVYLTGYAQRSTDDWAGLGQAYPDWMHDYNAALIRDSHANYIRWMHIAPQRVDVEALDRFGIVRFARPAIARRTSPAANGNTAPKSCAIRLFTIGTSRAFYSGRPAIPSSLRRT